MTSSSPTSPNGYLHSLCRQGDDVAIRTYLQGMEDVNMLEESLGFLGHTPLHSATSHGQTKVVRLLLLYGANVNAKAHGSYTPLHIAASMDNADCVIELLAHKADVTSKDEFDKTPYDTAIINRNKRSARILKTEEVKKAARENNSDLMEILTSISLTDVIPSCFKEALLEASRGGHVEAICSLIVTAGRHTLQLKNCVIEALKSDFFEAAAMLLTCYAAKHEKRALLKYLISVKVSKDEELEALSELPQDELIRGSVARTRYFSSDDRTFRIAVPIKLALTQKKKEAVGILLLNTRCNKEKKQVEWSRLALGEIDPIWIENITWVEKLSLTLNLLISVPSNISVLENLCLLDLRSNQLKIVPSCLLELPSLRELKLSGNKITELPKECNWSPSLRLLYLSDNSLQTLPIRMAEAKLSTLHLAQNNLYEVPPCVCEIITLESLDLSGNPRLTQLPQQMGRLRNILFLKLENLEQLTDPPDEIKQDGVKTIMYLRNTLRNSKPCYTVKLMLVGRAGQGKTTLMHRLRRDYTYNQNTATNGIDIDEFRYSRNAFGIFNSFAEYTFQVWDFGGQEEFYTTHQCFLSTLALYLLVWNLEEGESGIEMLRGWLDNIFATTSTTNLIIVGTHLDKVRKSKEPGFPERMRQLVKELVELPKYSNGQIISVYIKEVSCALDNREGIDDLRNTIYDAASNLKKTGLCPVSVMGEKIPHSFRLVADAIQNQRRELNEQGRTPIMHKTEYEALVHDIIRNDDLDIEDSNDLRDVTQFMHERGVLLHYDDPNQDLQDLYFLDPKWLCDLMAGIVTLPNVNSFGLNGILDLSNLSLLLRGERFPRHNYSQFIRLLNRFQIACSLDDNRVLIPSKVPVEKPAEATNDNLHYVTVKRIHSFPCIPHGFWNRLIARFLFYVKDMLSTTENVSRSEATSPFQLDPFCCRCPLLLDNFSSGAVVEGSPGLPRARDASFSGSCENAFDFSAEIPGVRYYGTPRAGAYINGRFFGVSDVEERTSRSDSGYEFSSDDDDEVRGTPLPTGNATFAAGSSRLSRNNSFRPKEVFKHGTHPGTRREDKVDDVECSTCCSDSSLPAMSKRFRPDDLNWSLSFASRGTRPEESFSTTIEQGGFGAPRQASLPWRELKELAISQETSRMKELANGQCLSLGDGNVESAPYHPVHPSSDWRENEDALMGPSFAGQPAGGEMSTSLEDLNVGVLPLFERSCSTATDESTSYDNTLDFSASGSEQETSCNGFDSFEKQKVGWDETDENVEEVQPLRNEEEKVTGVSHSANFPHPEQQEALEPSASSRSDPLFHGVPVEEMPTTSPPTISGCDGDSSPHLPHCPLIRDFSVETLPHLPTDLASLIDQGFLHCWKSGVCLQHPRLFVLLSCSPDPNDPDRNLVVTEVSPSQQGRKVLSYVVDHIDTLVREWHQELANTDGYQPKVRQLIPCFVCERLGLEPHNFKFVQCQQQSSKADTICCPKHPRLQVDLHQVVPDIMFHDVDADLLLSHDDISYEDTDGNILGSGGYGKVVRGQYKGRAVAIKFYKNDMIDPLRHYREVRKELNVLRRVRHHPFLISVIGVTLRPLCLVLELAEGGTLMSIFQRGDSINRIVLFRIAYQIAEALRFLHALGVIYRDLKPENVLVWSLKEQDDLHVKLIDFGTANFATSTGLVSVTGTPGIHAPEMLECANKEEYTAQVDVYSYAILLYKLITRLVPFEEYDSLPKINAAVISGERPKWREVPVAMIGLPTLTELMLQCWLSRPMSRPTTAKIVEQVCQPAFQCLFAKQPIPSVDQSVRHVCLVPTSREVWLACDGHPGNKIFIYDGRSLDLKFSFPINSYQEKDCSFQIQCMHFMATHVLIGVRGTFDLVFVYSASATSRYKLVTTIAFNEQLTSVTSNDEYIFVGLNDARVRCILKSEMKKSDKKRGDRSFKVGRHRILSMVVVQDKLWVSSSRYIFRYFTKPGEVEAFEADAMWYGGPEGMEDNPQTKVSLLKSSLDEESVFSVCRSILSKWDVTGIKKHHSVDCSTILHALNVTSTETVPQDSNDASACITCVELTRDTVWAGTASGHILILDALTGHLVTWFHSYEETRTLTFIQDPGQTGTEQGYVISTGKGLRREGLGAKGVCVLSPERVWAPPEIKRRVSESKGKTFGVRKVRSPTPPCDDPNAADEPSASVSLCKCTMIMWEAVSKECFARIEAKSGRKRYCGYSADKASCEDYNNFNRSTEENLPQNCEI